MDFDFPGWEQGEAPHDSVFRAQQGFEHRAFEDSGGVVACVGLGQAPGGVVEGWDVEKLVQSGLDDVVT